MELTINQLIKIIIGLLVVVVVIGGIYFFFKYYVIDYFNNIFGEEASNFFLSLI